VACNIITPSFKLVFICCYISPSLDIADFIDYFNFLSSICSNTNHCIVIGDFNLPHVDWTRNYFPGDTKSQCFYTFINDFGFSQYVQGSTRKGNLLDLLLANDSFLIADCNTAPPFANSDHDSIEFLIVLPSGSLHSDRHYLHKPMWDKANWDSFADYANQVDWNALFAVCDSPDSCLKLLSDFLSAGIALFVPSRVPLSSRPCNRSKLVRKLTAKKRLAWRHKRADPCRANSARFIAVSDALSRALREEAAVKEARVISSGSLGQFFKFVNSRLNHKNGIAPIHSSDGTFLFTDVEKAEAFSCFFSENYTTDNGTLPSTFNSTPDNNMTSVTYSSVISVPSCCSLNIIYFDVSSVYSCLNKLRVGSSPGPDGIPAVIFKNLAFQLSLPLSIMFNLIVQFGSVPHDWLLATVVPIFKKGTSSKIENYRPISLTSSCCKIFESLVKLKLLEYLNTNGIISPGQHGFLSKRSTCTNLLEALNDWTQGLNRSNSTLVLFVDFAKAFDSVSIHKLIFKLQLIGIGGKLLQCISSLLIGRSQRVKVGGALSVSRAVRSGVPQGSVLGPLLFLVFINDITRFLPPPVRCKLFADDLKSYITFNDDHDHRLVPVMLEAISLWSTDWQLPLSISKCNWMLISNCSTPSHDPLILSGSPLERVNEVKDLGVLFNSKLNFSSHISNIVSKAKQRLYLLFKAFPASNADALILAFKSYILPILDYCSPVWNPCLVGEIILLESVQRAFTKRLSCCQNLTYSDRLRYCGLDSLERRRLIADLVLLFKILNNLIDIDLGDSISLCSGVTRGHSLKLAVKGGRINARLHFFSVRTVNYWNFLPDFCVSASSVFSFRASLSNVDFSKFLSF
jgi:hypothetical protein